MPENEFTQTDAERAQTLFEQSALTPQEAADLASMHINTVKKILNNHYVHRNSITKFLRVLDQSDTSKDAHVVAFPGSDGRRAKPKSQEDIRDAVLNAISVIEDRLETARQKPQLFFNLDIDDVLIDYDKLGGLLTTYKSAQSRLKRSGI